MSFCCGKAAQAVEKAKAIAAAYKNYVTGENRELSEQRLAICQGKRKLKPCDFYKRGLCVSCGCILALKTTLPPDHPEGKCPEGLW